MVPPPVRPLWQLHPQEAAMIGAAWEEYVASIPPAKRGKLVQTALEKAPLLTAITATAMAFWGRAVQTFLVLNGQAPPPGWRPPPRQQPPGTFPDRDELEARRAAAQAAADEAQEGGGEEPPPPPPPEDPSGGFPSAASELDAAIGGAAEA